MFSGEAGKVQYRNGPMKINKEDFAKTMGQYDGEIRFLDEKIHNIILHLKEKKLFDNTLIVKKQLSTTEPPAYLGNNLTRIRVDTHTIPVGAEVRLTGTKNYNGIYTNFNDSSDDSILNNYIYIEKEYVAENFLVGATVYSGQIYAEVAEGTPREFTYVAVGSADEEIVLFTDTSDNNYLDVDIVDAVGNVIAPVTVIVPPQKELFLTNDTDNYYCELENRNDFSALIFTFGDGLNTKKLNPGDLIRFRYADTLGDLGNVASKGLVTRVNGNLSTANGSPATIYLTNLDPIVGGQGYESLESIRSNGKNLFQAGYRAGSENDWKTIVEKHPSVLKASIWTEYDVNPSAITGRNNIIYITGVSTIGQALDVSVEQDVANNFLADKKSPSDIVFFRRLLIVNAKFKVQATISPQAKAGIVKNDITNSLLAKYAVVNSNFFANVHDSNFTRIIDNNADVEFNSTEVFHVEKSEFHPKIQASVGGYEVVVSRIPDIEPDPSKQILIEEDSVEIWILRKIGGEKQEAKQIAETSGDTITGINNYSISNGTVSYFTNQISFTINNLLPGGFVPVGEPDYNTGDPPGSGTGPTPYTAFGNLNPL